MVKVGKITFSCICLAICIYIDTYRYYVLYLYICVGTVYNCISTALETSINLTLSAMFPSITFKHLLNTFSSFYYFPGLPLPMLYNPFHKENFPSIHLKPLMIILKPFSLILAIVTW